MSDHFNLFNDLFMFWINGCNLCPMKLIVFIDIKRLFNTDVINFPLFPVHTICRFLIDLFYFPSSKPDNKIDHATNFEMVESELIWLDMMLFIGFIFIFNYFRLGKSKYQIWDITKIININKKLKIANIFSRRIILQYFSVSSV